MTHDNVTDIERLRSEFLERVANPNDYHVQMASWCYLNAPKLFEEIATLRKQLENARDALRPFAQIVGKSNSAVTLTIGNYTWTHVLTTKHFEIAAEAYRSKP